MKKFRQPTVNLTQWLGSSNRGIALSLRNERRKILATKLRGHIERLEDRCLLSGNTGLEYLFGSGTASNEFYDPSFQSSERPGKSATSDVNTSNEQKNSFRSGEILVGFVGDVVTVHQKRGVEQALQVAAGLVTPFGLSGGKALFHSPSVAKQAARLATQWSLPANADVMQVVEQLKGIPGIAYAEPNGIMTVQTHTDPLLPNDPSFKNPSGWTFGIQDHLPQINVEQSWHTNTTMGAGVTVAVVDTGIDLDHPDLNGNIKSGTTILIGSTSLGQDDNGHGTHVAGIIAAEINNMDDLASQAAGNPAWKGGTVGVAPQAKIMPVKVLSSGGSGSWADIAKGIDYAVNNGANIINMSLGGGFSQTIATAILNAYSKAVLVISAAGNSNSESSGHPAADPYSLSIAAVDSNDVRANFSNYGFSVDVAAPGVKTLSTFIDLDPVGPTESGSLTGAYGRISGTSMATPAAAGVAALIWSQMMAMQPGWSNLSATQKVQAVASQLLATAQNIDTVNPSYVGKLGAGRIDAAAALGPQVTAPVVIAAGGLGPQGATLNRLEVGQLINIQYSHVMYATSVLDVGNYKLTYLGADGVLGGLDDQAIDLLKLTTVYDAFPGRGVQLKVNSQAPDGNYQFRVVSGGIRGSADGSGTLPGEALDGDRLAGAGGDFIQTFSIVPRPVSNFQPVEPIGSMVYQTRVADTFNSAGDVDRFSFQIDGDPKQIISVRVNSLVSSTITTSHSVDGVVNLNPNGSSGPLRAGTITLEVTGAAVGAYSIDVLLNAVRDSGTPIQNLDNAFVTLADKAVFPKLAHSASQAVVLGSSGSYVPGAMLDSFEDGTNKEYAEQSKGNNRTSNATVSTSAAHDGRYGLADATNFGDGGWIYRVDPLGPLVQRGDTISVWVRSAGAPSGRGYFGFGSSATGTLSMQMAPNTNQLILGRHAGYSNYQDLAVVPQSWQADKWYRFVIDWKTTGEIVGQLFDSNGTTLLNTLTGNDTTITGGGIAFRSFDSTKHFDTVQKLTQDVTPDVYSFTLAAGQTATDPGQTATLAVTRLAGPAPKVEVSRDNRNWTDANSITVPVGGQGGLYYARVTGGMGTEYGLQILRSAVFDAGNNNTPETAQPMTQLVALGAIRPIVVGYFTDFAPTSTRPAAPILKAGYIPRQITNIETFDLSTIDVLTLYEQNNGGVSSSLLNRLPAIETWVRGGGRLTVHDRFVSPGAASRNPLIVGRSDILVTRDFTADIDVITGNTLLTNGPGGTVTDTTLDGGNSSSHGYAVNPTNTTQLLSFGPNRSNVSSFSYTLDEMSPNAATPLGLVYYSTIPLDYYLSGTTPFNTIYAPNTVAYAAKGLLADEDWYVLTTSGSATIETRTPSDAAGQFANTLDPQLQLYKYDSNGLLVMIAPGSPLPVPNERNEIINIPYAGTWLIRVIGQSDGQRSTVGEYILIDPPISTSVLEKVATPLMAVDASMKLVKGEILAPLFAMNTAPLYTVNSEELHSRGRLAGLNRNAVAKDRDDMNSKNSLEVGRGREHGLLRLKLAIEKLSGPLDDVEDKVHQRRLDSFFTDLANDLTNKDAFDRTHRS